MTDEQRDLIGLDEAFEKRWWGFMKVMWVLMVLAIIAGLSGWWS